VERRFGSGKRARRGMCAVFSLSESGFSSKERGLKAISAPASKNACRPMIVTPGFMPGIHVFSSRRKQNVDGRDKPGHDGVAIRPAKARG
jgi:hypothetical protein